MWRRACPLLTGLSVVALIVARRRLREAQSELDRMRTEAPAARDRAAQPGATAASPTAAETSLAGGKAPAETAAVGSDLSSEWEQAVPPMDS